jgi:SpoVK/Ycf46/Vps4 family AAA+-type ATPase
MALKMEDMRGVRVADFQDAMSQIRPSVNAATLCEFEAWNSQYGVSGSGS